jgi:exopolysaccharide biosynthesis polyprenyl glycosylphosphotransferase
MIGMIQRALMPFPLVSIALFVLLPEMRTPVGLGLLATIALLLVLRPIDMKMRTTLQFKTRVLVIGQRPIARKFLDEIERFPERGCTIIGIVEERLSDPTQRSPFLVLGTIDELKTIVAAVKPDLIVVALSDRRGRLPVTELLEFQSNGIRVEELADAYERISGKLPIELVTPGQLIASQRLRKSQALKIAQRVLSFTAAVILLALFAPILGIIAIAIKLDSGGSILFRQTRLGKGCRPFQLLKFRTMEPVERPASEWVRDNFERITRVGKWLRRLRFDELPQLVNVIRGDMNLVGPRPHPVGNLQLFRDSIPYYALRSSIRPGITGWAQVRYHYANNLEEETEKMRYDLYYIKHMSIAMDLRIVLKTFGVFLRSLAKSFEDEDVIVTKPRLAVGPTRLRIRVRTERANSATAEETQHQRLPVQL